ncbi:precorrin-4 C(11)-methyltransferase [Vulcanisaeta distributa]|uniref:uroporphyrinogen-III C-methyltransferase n=1 Tax=Vulcanisaeta distributa (strain DSM 14429 / JCM 11212 / NBRC 100878 / IC-017) TaxID=572478 RepID=E1QNJ3_VULDI|nr:precorrin-4 C(11)-methyltransferase [Vulcanisaeta distributa]ADN51281.1 precorrin-4 C11-methyltransferase [Vulcanisaeta distributa DSM 14429]
MVGKVVFVGAGPGDPELITVKGMKYLQQADVVIYAGSLVNPEVLRWARPGAEIHNSASMTLEEIVDIMITRAREGKLVVRLKSGDASIYGALLEEIIALREAGIPYEVVPGVTAALAAAAVLGIELTLPKVAQTLIITRASARVPMQGSIKDFAKAMLIGATMAIYTGVHLIDKVVKELREAGVPDDTPVAVVYKATWPDQVIIRGTLSDIAEKVKRARITKDSVIIVGKAADPSILDTPVRSSVYDPRHTHSFRPKPKINSVDTE